MAKYTIVFIDPKPMTSLPYETVEADSYRDEKDFIVFYEKVHPASTAVDRVYSVNRSEVRSIRKNS